MRPYSEVLKEYNNSDEIPYHVLLQTNEWKHKRDTIVKRDNYVCRFCNIGTTYFIKGSGHVFIHQEIHNEWLLCPDDSLGEFEYVAFTESFIMDKQYIMHVHHKHYVLSNLPWDYPDDDLITLCNWCHHKFHQENSVDVFLNNDKTNKIEVDFCKKCFGAGWFPEFQHIENGVCFLCMGKRFQIKNFNKT
jgi:hypothetical protein